MIIFSLFLGIFSLCFSVCNLGSSDIKRKTNR
nr:MAG TPA: hypothetical protein [Caudoviricetes sp.]